MLIGGADILTRNKRPSNIENKLSFSLHAFGGGKGCVGNFICEFTY